MDKYCDPDLAATDRKKRKDATRVANKKAWAEKTADVKAKLPIGYSASDDKKRMQEFKNQLLTDHNVTTVTKKILAIALDDDHPGQMSALKMCWDRQLPTSVFDSPEAKAQMGNITIVIGDARGEDKSFKVINNE